MGVLACDRNGCKQIMCDRSSSKYGYICNECFEELKACGPGQNIKEFMQSQKPNPDDYYCDNGLEEIFPLR